MTARFESVPAPLARWSSSLALFSACVILVAGLLHRLTSFPTPATLNLFRFALAGAGLAVLAGLIASVQIWRRGYSGARSAAGGTLLGSLLLAWPLAYLPAVLNLPEINDVTTDWTTPPRFVALAKERGDGANPMTYPGERFAREQQQAYPDLRPFLVDRPPEETFEIAIDAIKRLKWTIAAEEPPAVRASKAGTIEAVDRTMILGFTDDVVVRVDGTAANSRVDVRSASRYGSHDLGQNAARVRRFFRELQARLEATAPGLERLGTRSSRAGALVPKRPIERSKAKLDPKSARDRALLDAQRARALKEKPR